MTIIEMFNRVKELTAQQQAQTTSGTTGATDVYTPPYTPPYVPQTEQPSVTTTTQSSAAGSAFPWLWIVAILALIFVYFKFIRK